MPILSAPITRFRIQHGWSNAEAEYALYGHNWQQRAGTYGMCGDGGNPVFYDSGLEAIKEENGHGIPIIKPRENSVIIEMANRAKQAKAPVVGVDIDGAGLVTMALMGQPVGPKNIHELKEIIAGVDLPFILKGIMTVDEINLLGKQVLLPVNVKSVAVF